MSTKLQLEVQSGLNDCAVGSDVGDMYVAAQWIVSLKRIE